MSNDIVEVQAGVPQSGPLDGGQGDDTLRLIGAGAGTLGANSNFEHLEVLGGSWAIQSAAYQTVDIAAGASVRSQVRLANQGEMNVAAGGSLLVTSGGSAVLATGQADIDNSGLIQSFDFAQPNRAIAISLNGGTVTNNASGVILAQGPAIATASLAVSATNIVNDGTIASLSGVAISLSGNQDDVVENRGAITGSVNLGGGDDTLRIATGSSIAGALIGGEGSDTLALTGTGAGSIGMVNSFENLVIEGGSWTVADSNYSSVTIRNGGAMMNSVVLNNTDNLTVEAGGRLGGPNGILWMRGTDIVADNAGTIESSSRVLQTTGSATGSFTLNNEATGVVRGSLNPQSSIAADATITINNAGLMEAGGRVIDFDALVANGARATINNLAGGTIRQTGTDTDIIRPGQNTTVNNSGTITTAPGFAGGGDAIDFGNATGGRVTNNATGLIEGSSNAVAGAQAVNVTNAGTMIGRNGAAVNIDNGGSDAERVYITNSLTGTMEGRSAELTNSDGDGVNVTGQAQVLNYGRIAGLGHQGSHNGTANVSEGVFIGGGSVLNYGAGAEIYGYGRGIQASDSATRSGLLINNDGLIRGDGNGPEGAASADLRGSEAVNLVGNVRDEFLNQSTGRVVGGVSMGEGNDHLQSLGSFQATGGSAIDMGAGNDTVYFYTGTTVQGTVLLGSGDDLVLASADSSFVIDAGDGDDQIYMGGYTSGGDDIISGGAGNDRIYASLGNDEIDGGIGDDSLYGEAGNDVIRGGEGDDTIDGGTGADQLFGDAGNDTIIAGAGDTVDGGIGDDLIEIATAAGTPASIDGGADNDTVRLVRSSFGATTNALGATTNVENLLVQGGTWTAAASDYSTVTIKDGAQLNSTVALNNNDRLTVDAGGRLAAANAVNWSGGGNAVVDNSGTIEGSTRALNTTAGVTGSLTFNNLAGGTVSGPITPQGAGHADAVITLNNAGTIESTAGGRVIDFRNFDNNGANAVINNEVGGIIRKVGSDDADVIRPGADATINNRGTITSAPGFADGGDAIDFQGDAGGRVNNWGLIEGAKHAVTGSQALTVVNNGTMIGRNGSAVNIDNGGSEADRVTITNNGTMEGRSAELSDSDGDAVDVDGLVYLMNYGRIAGLGHEGYKDGEPNISEGLAIGGGTILNYGTNAEIYGYGRAIQVDNSSNSNALGTTFINNDGLILGDGNGPEGVDPADAARFDLRGNEAINLVGNFNDEILNQSTGRIVGGVSMGGGDDRMNNSGSITATGGSAIDMGAGNDVLNLYVGATVAGDILLGAGNDRLSATTISAFTIDAGDGDDEVYITSYTDSGSDTVSGGAGNDRIYTGLGNDQIDGGIGNDSLYGEGGDDTILGGEGEDRLEGGAGNDQLDGSDGNDILIGGSGNDILTGGAGNDSFVFYNFADGVDTVTDFSLSGPSADQLWLSSGMFQNFSGDDAFDLIGSGYLRAVSNGGTTDIQVDLDGGGDAFSTLVAVNGDLTNGALADHTVVFQGTLA